MKMWWFGHTGLQRLLLEGHESRTEKGRWRTRLAKWEVACGRVINILTWWGIFTAKKLPPTISMWFIKVYIIDLHGFLCKQLCWGKWFFGDLKYPFCPFTHLWCRIHNILFLRKWVIGERGGEQQWDTTDCFHCSTKLTADFQGQN